MSTRLTVTLGVCLATGIAAGIGLARPGLGEGAPPPAAAPGATTATTGAAGSGGFGSGVGSPAAASPAPAPSGSPAPAALVTIEDFAFTGLSEVVPGATVEVVNADGTDHTLTAEGRGFDTGTLAGGGRGRFTAPDQPGPYRFFCAIHPSMEGTLTVAA